MKYRIYYDSKSHGKKFGQKSKRRWFVDEPSKNPAKDNRPVWSYEKEDARLLTEEESEVVMGMATIQCGYFNLKRVAA